MTWPAFFCMAFEIQICLTDMRARETQTAATSKDTSLFPFWVEDRGLSFFLAFLVLITILVPMIPLSRLGRIGLDLVFALMLFSIAVATIRQRALIVSGRLVDRTRVP